MWRVRFQDKRDPENTLLTRSGVHNREEAAFYAEAILANPASYTLIDDATGLQIEAKWADPNAIYYVEGYWDENLVQA